MVSVDTNQLIGVIYRHENDDFSIWLPELSEVENKEINVFLEKFTNSGCSIRGTKRDIIDEVAEDLK